MQADEVVSVTTGVGRSTADFEHILDSDAADKAMPQSLWQPVAVPGDEQYIHIYIHTYIPASGSRYDSLYICIYI